VHRCRQSRGECAHAPIRFRTRSICQHIVIIVKYLRGGGVEIDASLIRQPSIYLDHDSLGEIARNSARRRRFLSIWKSRGELLFSWANAIDISGPQEGSALAIKELLEALGPYWIPLELNPWKVVRKEAGGETSSGTPCVSESFLNGYFLRLRQDVTNLGRVVDLVHEDRDLIQRDLTTLKFHANHMIQGFRREYRRNRTSLDRILPALPNDPARPTAYLVRELERLITRQLQFQWTMNDGIDFMHASVAATCADFLLVDRQWKRRILEVAPPRSYSWVYYRREIDDFMTALEKVGIGK
jgi:hypothetical protein